MPKSSRIVCSGLLNASAIPLGAPVEVTSSAPFATGQSASNGRTLGAALARDLGLALRGLAPKVVFATEHGHLLGYEPAFPRMFADGVLERLSPQVTYAGYPIEACGAAT